MQSMVFIVEDDASVREALVSLVRSADLTAQSFGSAREFLVQPPPQVPCCLVLDVRLPGLSGLDLQHELGRRGQSIPIIFITGHGDIPMSVRAMKAGAAEFLVKPFRDADLLSAIAQALDHDRHTRRRDAELSTLRQRHATLTAREREVMELVVNGRLNKQAAADLGITEVTVKVHRHHVMTKMGATTLADLVRMWEKLA